MGVCFLDVAGVLRWLADTGTEKVMADLVSAMRRDFARWQSFETTARVATHCAEGVIELMPTSDGRLYAFKYVNGHPSNPDRGFQTVTAFGVLSDLQNGYPIFVAEMTVLTALRTAAASVLAARFLARRNSSVMAMIGCGSQSEFQAIAFRTEFGLRELRIWDTDPSAMNKLETNATRLGFRVYRARDAKDACTGSDIVTTCTADKTNAVVLPDGAVAPGMHINAIGGDCPGKTELDPVTVARSDVFVEYTPQTRVEGEIQRQDPDFPVTELWEVVQGVRPGRQDPMAITLFDSVGFAVEDFSTLTYVHHAVSSSSHATTVDLVAEPVDPKDLFGFVSTT